MVIGTTIPTLWNALQQGVENLNVAGDLLATPLLACLLEDPFRYQFIPSVGPATLRLLPPAHGLNIGECCTWSEPYRWVERNHCTDHFGKHPQFGHPTPAFHLLQCHIVDEHGTANT